jgi:hypothetical protein
MKRLRITVLLATAVLALVGAGAGRAERAVHLKGLFARSGSFVDSFFQRAVWLSGDVQLQGFDIRDTGLQRRRARSEGDRHVTGRHEHLQLRVRLDQLSAAPDGGDDLSPAGRRSARRPTSSSAGSSSTPRDLQPTQASRSPRTRWSSASRLRASRRPTLPGRRPPLFMAAT